jgi:hypothetical protein
VGVLNFLVAAARSLISCLEHLLSLFTVSIVALVDILLLLEALCETMWIGLQLLCATRNPVWGSGVSILYRYNAYRLSFTATWELHVQSKHPCQACSQFNSYLLLLTVYTDN